MAGTELTYEQAVTLFKNIYGSGEFERFEQAWNSWGAEVGTEDVVEILRAKGFEDISAARVKVVENTGGGIKGYVGEFSGNYPSVINSNVTTSGTIKTPINTTSTVVAERNVISAKVGLREAGKFAIGSVVPAIAATSLGITLGKTIDSALYNLNPDFWDSHNMSTLDPSTWDTITTKEDGIGGKLFDMIFGLNDDGTTQAYLDEDALAYLSWWMQTAGVFDTGTFDDIEITTSTPVVDSLIEMSLGDFIAKYIAPGARSTFSADDKIDNFFTNHPEFSPNDIGYISQLFDGIWWYKPIGTPVYTGRVSSVGTDYSTLSQTLDVTYSRSFMARTTGATVATLFEYGSRTHTVSFPYIANYTTRSISSGHEIVFVGHFNPPITGIGSQTGADTPDTTGWNDLDSTKQSLQNQYPQLWDGAKHQDYVDENGNNRSTTLIPINFPNAKNPTDEQPTSGNRTQDEPLIDPTTATTDLIKTITDLITNLTPPNPTGTGGGDSPTTVTPVGRASSLWKIYNPTQAQVDAFGSWLWDSSFVEQIKKLFSDPMQAIIGIHKVFATPSVGGTATIKVGYLDSQVPSDWVDNQYTTVDCGTVSLTEDFGNVFDYSPYTKVSLYLPFIGIVDLDVGDVMRANISVKYHVDVLSGACLADVKVSRDGANAVLYQYSGSAIVTYPVSSGNYMGMVAGVLSVASGVAGTILSGGALAPALIGGAVGASHLHTDVSHSGGFSGCAGAMAGKKPYLIISRPITHLAGNFKHYTGYPANSTVILKDCSGFTRVKSVYAQNISKATNAEKDMIEAQLKAGVLV